MHDPQTVAFVIRSPIVRRSHQRPDGTWWKYRRPILTIWHVDPELHGDDDSCGWSWPRCSSEHRKAVHDLAEREFEFWFGQHAGAASGGAGWAISEVMWWAWMQIAMLHGRKPRWGSLRIRLSAAEEHEIKMLASNPLDNLRYVAHMAGSVDGLQKFLVLVDRAYRRLHRRWWQEPRWHVHHWKLQFHPWETLRRRLLTRCAHCGKPFGWQESPISHGWGTTERRWFRGEVGLYHRDCSAIVCAVAEKQHAKQVHH